MYFDTLKTAKKNAYAKKGITSDESLRRFVPRKYKDFSKPGTLKDIPVSDEGAEIGVISSMLSIEERTNNGKKYIVAKMQESSTGEKYTATFMNMHNAAGFLSQFIGHPIAVMGKFKRHILYGCSVMNPTLYHDTENSFKIYPVYSKIQRVSEESFAKDVEEVLNEKENDTIPDTIRQSLGITEINDALDKLHAPNTMADVEAGVKRLKVDDLLYFNLRLLESIHPQDSQFVYRNTARMESVIKNQPFALTGDQDNAIHHLAQEALSGKVIDALIQGDVGCGKTIIAFALMALTAENGYQAVMMAPTQILAQQHHDGLKTIASEDEIAYLYGVMKKRERDAELAKIKSGSARFIVGTQSLLSNDVEYNNLALVITDEEHRFGVEQRSKLLNQNINTITMSATPIPRSYVQAVYGEMTEAIQIKEKPAGRKEVITYYSEMVGGKLKNFIYKQLTTGMQAYVICPMKEENFDEDSPIASCISVEEVFAEYSRDFGKYGFTVGQVTGSTPKDEKEQVIEDFRTGKIHILISTTVVEVGVNVPNANLIVIMNAERFGLATMHQLRGRVGRGKDQGYCVLASDSPNNRIRAMCSTTDGFKIAEADFLERKSGNLIGDEQSGKNRLVETMFAEPELNSRCKEAAKMIFGTEIASNHISTYDKAYGLA